MKYNGIELKEITEPQIINPPKEMLVWDDCDVEDILEGKCDLKCVKAYGIIADSRAMVIGLDDGDMVFFDHCAEIPEEPKPRRATNRELSKWIAQGNGECKAICSGAYATTSYAYKGADDGELEIELRIRKWDDTEWHEPTTDYMGLE